MLKPIARHAEQDTVRRNRITPIAMLSPRQQELLSFLKEHHRRCGLMPSSREIQQHFGFASQTAAMDLLRALERKGAIRRLRGKARAVVLAESDEPDATLVRVPLLGRIAAGMPASAEGADDACLHVDPRTLGMAKNAPIFALRVQGDSMIDAHIVSGDYVILETREPRSGDIVAALIDGENTLKRFVVRDGAVFLKAENALYPDLLPAHDLRVQGVMVGLLRPRIQPAA